MKYAIYLLALLTLACSKKEAASETPMGAATSVSRQPEAEGAGQSADGQSEQAAAPREAPPTINLIEAGAPPLRQLRWELKKGATEILEMESAYTFQAETKGYPGVPEDQRQVRKVLPAIVQTIELGIDDMSAAGLAQVAFEVTNDQVLDASDATDALYVTGAKGTKGGFRVSSKGVISDFALTVPPEAPEGADLEYVENLLRLIVFPLPDEPIGVGAKWTVTRVVERRGMPTNEQVALELVELAGSEMGLKFKLESHGSKQETVGKAQHEALRTQDLRWDASGRTKISLTNLVPRSLTLENDVVLKSQLARPTGAVEHLDMSVDRRVEIRPE